jgi:hypothetical protein
MINTPSTASTRRLRQLRPATISRAATIASVTRNARSIVADGITPIVADIKIATRPASQSAASAAKG